jgi:glyoxylase-like metal-dependent hydrolase (beta-lactamase superfamily II)
VDDVTKPLRRRTFLVGSAAAGVAVAGLGAGVASASRGVAMTRSVGPFEIIALLDASGPFFQPARATFSGASERDWARARRADPAAFGPDDAWHLDFRAFAVRLPAGRFALVDTGIGPVGSPASAWAPVPGHLLERLAAAGIARSAVSLVVLTHLHEDHFGWSVSLDGVPTFPNARYVIQRNEITALEQAGDEVVLPYVVDPLRRTGQLSVVDGRSCLAERHGTRMTTEPTPGHTPGHQSVVVRGDGHQVVVTGDVLVHAVQLVAPHVGYAFEGDQDVARRTRQALLGWAGRLPTWLATAHLNQPFVRPGR